MNYLSDSVNRKLEILEIISASYLHTYHTHKHQLDDSDTINKQLTRQL